MENTSITAMRGEQIACGWKHDDERGTCFVFKDDGKEMIKERGFLSGIKSDQTNFFVIGNIRNTRTELGEFIQIDNPAFKIICSKDENAHVSCANDEKDLEALQEALEIALKKMESSERNVTKTKTIVQPQKSYIPFPVFIRGRK